MLKKKKKSHILHYNEGSWSQGSLPPQGQGPNLNVMKALYPLSPEKIYTLKNLAHYFREGLWSPG